MATLKRQLALFLVLAMMLSMIPVSAFADADSTPPEAAGLSEVNESAPAPASAEAPAEISKPADSDTAPESAEAAETTSPVESSETSEESTASLSVEVSADDTEAENSEASPDDAEAEGSEISIEEAEAEENSPAEEMEADIAESSDAPALFSLRRSAAVDESCPHLNTVTEADASTLPVYRSVSDSQHVMCVYKFDFCRDCVQRISENYLVESALYSDHTLDSSGVCTVCGYSGSGSDPGSDTDCKHANKGTHWDYAYLVDYVPLNSTSHKTSGYQRTYCIDCYTTIGTSVPAEIVEDHSFSAYQPGWCSLCGYCEHRSKTTSWYSGPRYTKANALQHEVSGYKWTRCESCYEVLVDEYEVNELENHSFDSSGKCTLCGYQDNGCPHKNTAIWWVQDSYLTKTIVDCNNHRIVGYQYIYCIDCGERISIPAAADVLEHHSSDINNHCGWCGFDADTYNHPNTEMIWDTRNHSFSYSSVSDTQHKMSGYRYYSCKDCYFRLCDSFYAEELYPHRLDFSGVCTDCGYTKTNDCNHTKTKAVWDGSYPKHYSCDVDDYIGDRERYHRVTGYQYDCCAECHERLTESYPMSMVLSHTFDSSGACTLCGYGAEADTECTHSETTSKLHDHSYTTLDKDYHESTRLYSKVCANKDCGEVLVEVEPSYTETKKEEHDFTNGKCHLCGYTKSDDLSVTVTADALTATTGDRISATATASGGSGGYQYGWKVLLDGNVKTESTLSTRASYDLYDTSVEGSYAFVVTVIDSEGNRASAQSEAISVASHKCTYETIIVSSELKNPTQTHHDLITVSYTECSVCHDRTETVETSTQEEHKPVDNNSYYEAAHPHKMYFICACGGHPYIEGEYKTVNGKVLDETECCLCDNHKYGELIQETKLVNSGSPTMHDQVTSSHRECVNCGKETNSITVTVEEEHSPKSSDSYGYKTGHPHAKYYVCVCGGEIVIDGQFNTANGKVQEESVCCLCNGHAFGEPTVGYDGEYYKICKNCYYTELVSDSDEPEVEEEKHLHNWTIDRSNADKHPHQYTAACACGAKETYNKMLMACCQCTGNHYWIFVRLSDGKTYKQVCDYCGTIQSATPTEQVQDYYKIIDMITYRHNVAKKYQDEHNIDSTATAIWKTIADQATDKLMDADFVTTNETLNTFSENSSITGAFKAAYGELTRETWDEQQTDLWETLLLRMLTDYYDDNTDSAKEYKKDANAALKVVKKVSEKTGSKLSDDVKQMEKFVSEIDTWILDVETQIKILYNDGNNTDALAAQEKLDKLKNLKKRYDDQIDSDKSVGADLNKAAHNVGFLMDCISVLAEGTSSAQAVAKRNDAFAEMLIHSDQCIAVLDNVYAAAVSVGNYNLANAADKIKQELEKEVDAATNQFLTETGAFIKGAAIEIGKKGLNKGFNWIIEESAKKGEAALGTVVKDAGSMLKILEMGAKGLRSILDWGGAYDAAQKLMTINQMDATMNITQVLKDNDSPYMVDLWGLLQTEGCVQAQEFLNAWEDGTGLNSTDLGIDNGGLFGKSDLPKVLNEIDEERDYYITALRLPLEKSD